MVMCMVCDYEGDLNKIPDFSKYIDGYVCPRCGVVQTNVGRYNNVKSTKLGRWDIIKKRLNL